MFKQSEARKYIDKNYPNGMWDDTPSNLTWGDIFNVCMSMGWMNQYRLLKDFKDKAKQKGGQ